MSVLFCLQDCSGSGKGPGHARLKTAMSFWFYKGEGFLDHLSDCHRSGCLLLCVIRETSALTLRETDCVKKDKDSTGM